MNALDHLGFGPLCRRAETHYWWKPLRSIESLGDLGIRALSLLFYAAKEIQANLSQLSVGGITDMNGMFLEASNFNQPIRGCRGR
jgi:hypothetical protein